MKFAYTTDQVAFEEIFEIVILWEPWFKGQTMTLTSSTHKPSCTDSDNSNYQIFDQKLQNFP